MKTGLVIVDAWDFRTSSKHKIHPELYIDAKAFGFFLNRVCELERKKGTKIIHSPSPTSRHQIMEEMKVDQKDLIVTRGRTLTDVIESADLDKIYFAGFHFGRCIHNHASEISRSSNIVLNLSMTFPGDKWKESIKSRGVDNDFRYYMWGPSGFESMKIENL
jgi:hypothetical protein